MTAEYNEEEIQFAMLLSLTGSPKAARKNPEVAFKNFVKVVDKKTADTLTILSGEHTQPRIIALRDIVNDVNSLTTYLIAIDGKILYCQPKESFVNVVRIWIFFHYLFNLQVEPSCKGIFYFFTVFFFKIEDIKAARLQDLRLLINQLKLKTEE